MGRSGSIRSRWNIAKLDALNFARFGVHAPRYAQRVYVDPHAIDLMLQPGPIGRAHSGRVLAGDWDVNVERLEESPKYVYCKLHFVEGLTWDEAGAYAFMGDRIRVDPGQDGCHTEADIVRRFERLDLAFEQIVRERQLRERHDIAPDTFRERGGVYIHFDRHGRIVSGRGGVHRLAIAKLTGLRSIPAQLGVVHRHAVRVWKDALVVPPARTPTTSSTSHPLWRRHHVPRSSIVNRPAAAKVVATASNSRTDDPTTSPMPTRSSEPSA
jgi:hypothetical protein